MRNKIESIAVREFKNQIDCNREHFALFPNCSIDSLSPTLLHRLFCTDSLLP